MIGIIVAVLLSALLLWLFDRSSIDKLGLQPTIKRVGDLSMGLCISFLCAFIYFWSLVYLSDADLKVNDQYNRYSFFASLWWVIKSVLFEEFLFRGALLYLAIKYVGSKTACIFSAIAFGVYHWFSYEILGDPGQMITVFILTSIIGLLLAYSFTKTKSLYLQTGLHLGWNFITIIIFSQGPFGNQLLIASNGEPVGAALTLVLFLFQLLSLPVLTILYLHGSITIPFTKINGQ